MLDPVSIITLTSFAMQAIEFVISSGLKVYTFTQEISDCEQDLWIYYGKLSRCDASLERWKIVWGQFSDATYIHFWGENEFKKIEVLLKNILTLASSIKRQITGHELDPELQQKQKVLLEANPKPSSKRTRFWRKSESGKSVAEPAGSTSTIALSDDDISVWQKVVEHIGSDSVVSMQVQRPGLARRLGFTLAQSALIQTRISRLEELVNQLDEFTRSYFRNRRGIRGQSEKAVTKEEAQDSEKLKKAVDDFNTFTSTLHQSYKDLQHQIPWSLELRVPDNKGSAALFDSASKLDLDITLSLTGDGNKGSWRRVRIGYYPSHNGASLAAALPQKMVQPDLVVGQASDSLYNVQGPLRRRSVVFRPLLRDGIFDLPATCKAWEEDRARLLLGLANWTILMWHSPWTAVPCCCGIRFLQLDTGPRQYTFAAEDHTDCRNALLTEYKLLLLGLTIAELLTGWCLRLPLEHQPGKRGSANYQRVCLFEKWDKQARGPAWEPCTRERILAEVKEKSLTASLVWALEYCFDYSPDFMSIHRSADVLPCLVENVLKPIQQFYDVIIPHRQESSGFSWFLTLLHRPDAQWPLEMMFEKFS